MDGEWTDNQWWAMCSAGLGDPVALHEADLTQPFVYDRAYGVFYVASGYHNVAMSLLLAFQRDLVNGIDAGIELDLSYPFETSEHYLKSTPGTAFRSSVGKQVIVGQRGNLTAIEMRYFQPVQYIIDLLS